MKIQLHVTQIYPVHKGYGRITRFFIDRMRSDAVILLTSLMLVLLVGLIDSTWAANCKYCFEIVSDNKKYCDECGLKLSKDLTEQKAREERLVESLNSSRENYKKALNVLSQFYLDIGFPHRLKTVRKELKALSKLPVFEYLLTVEKPTTIKPAKNIEEANILFQDGMMYKKSLNIINKKSNLNTAVKRFKKILDYYPESDMVDDAAYELAEIFDGFFFQNHEVAAAYYVKCFELNPNTNKPARYMAASVYEDHLKDYEKAVHFYELALEMSKDENLRKKAQSKITELKKQEF